MTSILIHWAGVCSLAIVLAGCVTAGGRVEAPETETEPTAPPETSRDTLASRSVLDGVFTRSQALRGERRFQQVCAACHRTIEISSRWFRAGIHETVGDIFEQIVMTMPEGNPGSLNPEDYADILAFVFRTQNYPAGEQELPADRAMLDNVTMPMP
jgi:mono/diheme cytochrome c family protein